MKAPTVILSIVAVAAIVVGGIKFGEYQKQSAIREDMKSTYGALLNAYDARDADSALKLLTDRTFEMYGGILQQALNANEKQTRALPPHELIEVLVVRAQGTRKDLKSLDGRGFVAHAVKSGWWNREGRLRVEDAKVHGSWGELVLVDGEWADAHRDQRIQNFVGSTRRTRVLRSHQATIPAPPRLTVRLVQEGGEWKVCEAGSAASMDAYIGELARLSGTTAFDLLAEPYDEDEDGKVDAKVLRAMK